MMHGESPFSSEQLVRFKRTLLDKRAHVIRDLGGLGAPGSRRVGEETREYSNDRDDRETESGDLGMAIECFASEGGLLAAIDAALEKLEEGVFGLCEESGEPIGLERLEALPWARYCVRVQREIEIEDERSASGMG